MNSTAKTTALSFLAASALGAAVFMGCTVTTGGGTFDGGLDDFDSGPSTADSGPSTADSGPSTADSGPSCASGQTASYIVSTACQACLDTNCCAKEQTLFAIADGADGSTMGGNKYVSTIDECASNADPAACYKDADDTASPGVVDAFNALIACKDANAACVTACGASDPVAEDGGADAN